MSIKGFSVGGNVERYDYNALDNIPSEITIDTALSGSSTNPVQNKVVTGAINATTDSVTALSGEVSDLKSALTTYTGNARINYTVQNAYYSVATVGSTVSATTASNNYECAKVSCSEGDKFTVNGGSSSVRLWGFLDADNKVLLRETYVGVLNEKVITAPENAAYLVINNRKVDYPNTYSYYGELLINKVDNAITDFNNRIGGYNPYDISLRSESGVGVYWNTYIPKTIKAGETIKVGLNSYSGNNFSDCRVYGITANDAQVTLIESIGVGKSKVVKASQNYKTLLVQIVRTSAEDNVTASFYVIDNVNGGLAGYVLDDQRHVFTVEKDGSGDFTSLVQAINIATTFMDSIVYVGPGEWDIIDEFGEAYMQSVSSTQRGLYLKNRVHLIFSSNAVVKALYTGFNGEIKEDTVRWFSVFNSGEYGFTLENCTIISRNIRYAVHDERSQTADEPYCNKYINCIMSHSNQKYDQSQGASGYAQCIGGGLGTDGHIIIDGCVFENPYQYSADAQGRKILVSYHVNNKSGATGRSMIDVHGCYFKGSGTIRAGYLGTNPDVSTMLVHDNSFGAEPFVFAEAQSATVENIEMIAWNNEIRTA